MNGRRHRIFLTLDALFVSVSFVLIATFYMEGSPGPLSTNLRILATDINYMFLGPSVCESFVCFSNLSNFPEPRSKASKLLISLGPRENFTHCEAACINFKVFLLNPIDRDRTNLFRHVGWNGGQGRRQTCHSFTWRPVTVNGKASGECFGLADDVWVSLLVFTHAS